MKLFKSQEERQQIDAARADFEELVATASTGDPAKVRELAARFEANATLASLSERERRTRGGEAFRAYSENVLADDHFTIDEEIAFTTVAQALGIEQDQFETAYRDVFLRLAVARANDGRLPVVESPHLMPKKNETVHQEVQAALMKEVTLREWRGGSQGVSFRVAKGVRYRVGQTRGHSVVVGTEMQEEDTGVLAVTSQRVAYLGSRKTLEIPYAKLMNFDVYTDGVRFHASNRQKAPLFKVEEGLGHVIAATLNTAVQRYNG